MERFPRRRLTPETVSVQDAGALKSILRTSVRFWQCGGGGEGGDNFFGAAGIYLAAKTL